MRNGAASVITARNDSGNASAEEMDSTRSPSSARSVSTGYSTSTSTPSTSMDRQPTLKGPKAL